MDAPPKPRARWYRLAPDWFVVGLLVLDFLLWLSEKFEWFAFNRHKGWTVLIAVGTSAAFISAMVVWWFFALVFRRRFQFSIRSLMLLVFAFALPFSWLAVEM